MNTPDKRNVRKPETQTALARKLGVSQAMVSRLAARGMPTDQGVAAARAWRRRNLVESKIKPALVHIARLHGLSVSTYTNTRVDQPPE